MKRIRILSAPRTAVGVSVSNGLLEIDIHSDSLPYEELAGILNSYRRRQKYYKLKSGEFLKLENNSLSVLSELADGLRLSEQAIRGGRISVPLYRASYIDAVLTSHNSDIQSHRDRYFKSLIRDMKSVADSDYEVPDAMKPFCVTIRKPAIAGSAPLHSLDLAVSLLTIWDLEKLCRSSHYWNMPDLKRYPKLSI